ncbi:MAG: hypothetical protein KBT06_02785 [Prevotellaceae bacterium]|nr:hypothetical protein [Candidatus Colivivens equi]
MTLTEINNLLSNSSIINTGTIILDEEDRNATLNEVSITDIPNGSVFCKRIDKAKFEKFCIPNIGHNKHGDHLLLTDDGVFVFELKSASEISEATKIDVATKFKSDKCMFKYVDEIFTQLKGFSHFFEQQKIRCILLYQALNVPIISSGTPPFDEMGDYFKKSIPNKGTITYNALKSIL